MNECRKIVKLIMVITVVMILTIALSGCRIRAANIPFAELNTEDDNHSPVVPTDRIENEMQEEVIPPEDSVQADNHDKEDNYNINQKENIENNKREETEKPEEPVNNTEPEKNSTENDSKTDETENSRDENNKADMNQDKKQQETIDDKNAGGKEFDENADGEATPDSDEEIVKDNEQAEDSAAIGDGSQGSDNGNSEGNDASGSEDDRSITETDPGDNNENLGTSDDAEAAATLLTYYQVLLAECGNELFECKKKEIYWETSSELTTIFKNDPAAAIIANASCYSVSSRLLEENLMVAPDWVVRKNPEAIIKVVPGNILGEGISDTSMAEYECRKLADREGWNSISAVRNGEIYLISEDLLKTSERRTAASLFLAKAFYPSLMKDVDCNQALLEITSEAGDKAGSGTYFYVKN